MIALVLGRNCALNLIRIDIESVGQAVDENGFGLEIENDLRSSREGHGRNDNFVAFFNAHRFQREMKRRGAGIHGHGMASNQDIWRNQLRIASPSTPS